MEVGDIETFCEDGSWRNRVVGFARIAEHHQTLIEAIRAGRGLADTLHVDHTINTGAVSDRAWRP